MQIWTDWQKNSNSHRAVFFPSVREALPVAGGLLPSQLVDNTALPGGVRVEYLPISGSVAANVVNRLRGMYGKQSVLKTKGTYLSQDTTRCTCASKNLGFDTYYR